MRIAARVRLSEIEMLVSRSVSPCGRGFVRRGQPFNLTPLCAVGRSARLGKNVRDEGRLSADCGALFQLRRDRGERGVELGADALHRGNDRNRDAGGDQTIFDSRGCRFVAQEGLDLGARGRDRSGGDLMAY